MALKLFVFILLVALTLADEIKFESCDLSKEQQDLCTVSGVSINVCNSNRLCRLRRGQDVIMSFNFTPKFSSQKLKNAVFASNLGDLPWADLDTDACKSTTCPIEADKTHDYAYSLHIGSKVPEGTYTVKWIVQSAEDDTKFCCFKTKIQIKKK